MTNTNPHIVLIGAGIMSATLGIMLKKLMPNVRISIYEYLDRVAAESSDGMNNSGTGHAAYCELNYTPVENNQISIDKALAIAESFEISKQFWAYLKESHTIQFSEHFINSVPHMSFVRGNVSFLKQRFDAMHQAAIFKDMQFSADASNIKEWAPLIMAGRQSTEMVAATRMTAGTDVNFGAITRDMMRSLESSQGVELCLQHKVTGITDLTSRSQQRWRLRIIDIANSRHKDVDADFLFIGAGGGALSLLQKTGIAESRGYAGFPVSGQFLLCRNQEVVQQHHAKVYGTAEVGAPPMSVPHLDTRVINGERLLFFGPYAGFVSKFLKQGSYLDLPASIRPDNIWPLLSAGMNNFSLTKYLVKQLLQSESDRFAALQKYYPQAVQQDWTLTTAGQRVQVIQRTASGSGELKFGTEVVSSSDGSVTALLGASPGASTSVSIMLSVLEKMFPEKMQQKDWQSQLKQMIPSFGESLVADDELCLQTRERSHAVLELES